MSEIAFQLGENFNVYLKNRPELKEGLHQVAEKYGISNKTDLLKKLLDIALEKAPDAPVESKAPAKKEGFFAAIDPMDQEMVRQMQADLWRSKKLKNDGILAYFTTIHKNLEEKRMFLLKPPKAIAKKLLDTTGPMIDEGDIQSESQFVSIVLRDHFRSLQKTKKEEAKPVEKPVAKPVEKSAAKAIEGEKPAEKPEEKRKDKKSNWIW